MLRVVLAVVSCAALAHAMAFTDCATDKSNTAITVNSLDISPAQVTVPGRISFSIDATVNRQIDHVFIQTELNRIVLGGSKVRVPCIGDTNIGSCDNIDACSVMDRIRNGSSIISQDLGQQIDKMFVAALGHTPQCPIMPEHVVITNSPVDLQPLPSALSILAEGEYEVTIKIKDDPTNPDDVGCIRFKQSLAFGHQTLG